MNRQLRILTTLFLSLATLSLVFAGGTGRAFAVQAVAHGQGVLWNVDRSSWLGNYELDDGNFGYCIDVTRHAPEGADFDYIDGGDAGWFSADDSARLAFISRHWGAPGDPLTAAAAQLATWTITGLAGHDQAYFAQRANGDAALVIQAANHMIQVANGDAGASRGATATAELELDGAGGTVVSQLVVDYLVGPTTLAPGSFPATMTLHGATFDNGSRTAAIPNGVTTHIRPDQSGATETVSVEVDYHDLPFGTGYRLGRNTGDTQNLLVTHPFPLDARASDSASAPNELPFRPQVQTTTSAAVAEPGTALTDSLRLEVHPDSATGGEWGVYEEPDGSFAPIPVVIESTLLGPFVALPTEAELAPVDAPEVCTVEVAVESGAGVYQTPPCTIEAPGYYVWTDSIDPARTPVEHGGDRLLPWQSRFGVAEETTIVPAAPTIETVASVNEVAKETCVSDHLVASGLPKGIDAISVTSTLLGPLVDSPQPGTTPDGWELFPVAGVVTTELPADGTYTSPCVTVSDPGFYYFVFETEASVPGAGERAQSSSTPGEAEARRAGAIELSAVAGVPLVPAISDTRVHESESIVFAAPPPTSTPPTPTTPTPTPSTPPGSPDQPAAPPTRLAQTGMDASPTAVSTALAVAGIIVGLAGIGAATRRWR